MRKRKSEGEWKRIAQANVTNNYVIPSKNNRVLTYNIFRNISSENYRHYLAKLSISDTYLNIRILNIQLLH